MTFCLPTWSQFSTALTGYLQLWRYWRDAFGDIRWNPEEILDFGGKLLVTTEQRGHGSGSSIKRSRVL